MDEQASEQTSEAPRDPASILGREAQLKRDFDKRGKQMPSRMLSKQDAADLITRIERMKNTPLPPEAVAQREHQEKMIATCSDTKPNCVDASGGMTGFIPRLSGKGVTKCEGQSIDCPLGRFHYARKVEHFLQTLGYGEGDWAKACLLRPDFIIDTLSQKYLDYALKGGYERRDMLLVSGETGPGKSFCALAVLAHVAAHYGDDTLFLKAEVLLPGLRFDQALVERARKVKFFVLDDMGVEKDDPDNKINLYSVIDARVTARLPTIITSNLSGAALSARYPDKRLLDRLLRNFDIVTTQLPSKRRRR